MWGFYIVGVYSRHQHKVCSPKPRWILPSLKQAPRFHSQMYYINKYLQWFQCIISFHLGLIYNLIQFRLTNLINLINIDLIWLWREVQMLSRDNKYPRKIKRRLDVSPKKTSNLIVIYVLIYTFLNIFLFLYNFFIFVSWLTCLDPNLNYKHIYISKKKKVPIYIVSSKYKTKIIHKW